jgi:outer membrane lipoprotein-sorting protein
MKRLLAALLFCAALTPAWAGPEAVLDRIRAQAGSVGTIQADFVQEKKLSVFDEVLRSSGKFAFAKPDRLRWELTSPVKTGFSIRGKEGRRWHEMTGEEPFRVDRDPMMGAVAGQLMAWATADFDGLKSQYSLEVTAENPARVRLVPRSEAVAARIEAIEVRFARGERYVEEVTVREKGGDYTRISFRNVRLDAPMADSAF